MALTSIKSKAPTKRAKDRVKLMCSCEPDTGPPVLFRLWECEGGIVEVECSDCYGDLPPYYTPEATQAMIREAVEHALGGRDEAESISNP